MSLMRLIAISGIFGSKNEDLDILPPPPPFPDIGIGKELKESAKEIISREKQKKEEQRKKQEKIKIPKLIREIDEGKIEFPKLEQKKSFFGRLFGKKDEELEKELEELEEIMPEPRLAARKLPEPGIPKAKIEFEEKDFDGIKEAEDEIKKAIDGMKEKSIAPTISGFFKREEKSKKESLISDATDAGKIETPEVMPRTFDKIDNVLEIEERIHKARMCLMDFKFDDAKRIYMEIMGLYSSISQKDRYKVYQDIKDLYYERKSAEKFSKI